MRCILRRSLGTRASIPRLRPEDHVFFRRAGRFGSRRARRRSSETYGAKVIDCGSMARDDAVDERIGSGRNRRDAVLAGRRLHRGLRSRTHFRRVPYGRRGTPVYTHLERTSQPMIRLVSGDLTLWVERTQSLRTNLSAAAAWASSAASTTCSRSAARTSIRARSTQSLNQTRRLRRRASHRHHARRRDGRMLVRVEAVPARSRQAGEDAIALPSEIAASLQKVLGLRAVVEIVAPERFRAPISRRAA